MVIIIKLFFRESNRCQDIKLICFHKLDVETLNIQGNIRRIDCKVCKNFIAITENETIINIDEIIDNSQNGWKKVLNYFLFVLC